MQVGVGATGSSEIIKILEKIEKSTKMEALDLIEKRIDSLNRILGPIPDTDIKGTEDFTDSLNSANTLISSAMTGRENITKVVERANELENYLDPNFLEQSQEVKGKEVYVNAIAPELLDTCDQLTQIKALEKTLGAEYFRSIPTDTSKLKDITQKNSDFQEQSEFLEESLILAMKRYGEIQSGLVDTLAAMNKRMDAIEDKLQKKKSQDE